MEAPFFTPGGAPLPGLLAESRTCRLFTGHDWSTTPLGPAERWPVELVVVARTMLASPVPMVILAGPEAVLLYNDGYALIAGNRHPGCFGMSAFAAWPEVVDFNRDVVARVHAGEVVSLADQHMVLNRNGAPEDVWLDLDYSPIVTADGAVVGVVCILGETTQRVSAERALAKSRDQLAVALGASRVVGIWDWDVQADRVYAGAGFADLYGVRAEDGDTGVPIAAYIAGIHPDDVGRMREALERSMATGEKFTEEYRVVNAAGGVRWVLAEGTPQFDAEGRCIRFPGLSVDITAQKEAAEAHARSEAAFRTLADAMPQMVWSTRPDGFHDYYNARWYEFTGTPPGSTDGEGWNGMFHEDDRETAWERWRHALATGEPYQIEYRLRHHSGVYRWVLGRAEATRDAEGRIIRWYGTCTDIHDARQLAAEREMVTHELSHRIKNIFSVLMSIISLSARSAPEARAFADQLRRRVEAMGRAHDFVRPHSRASRPMPVETTVFGLIRELLIPFATGQDGQIVYLGDDLPIGDSAATPLALLLHELATNSAKYGGLSRPEGRLEITGVLDGDAYGLTWRETGGPGVTGPPQQEGFGSRLMRISVEGQLGGRLERAWNPEGIRVGITFPVRALTRNSALVQAASI
ncbi:sensor histidine kinase [Ensifer soli]|uniref:sensor histidine kinase n=1 Tax=Ciceribacter sp. sgz301302 TaxID=3342379 RepID=UPI0035B81313